MSEKVSKLNLKRDHNYLYFVDKDGDVSRTPRAIHSSEQCSPETAAKPTPPAPIAAQAEKVCKCGHSENEHDDGRLCCTHQASRSLMCMCEEFSAAEQVDAARLDDAWQTARKWAERPDKNLGFKHRKGCISVGKALDCQCDFCRIITMVMAYHHERAASLKHETQPLLCSICLNELNQEKLASSSPLDTPAAVPDILCKHCGKYEDSVLHAKFSSIFHVHKFEAATPAPADTGAAGNTCDCNHCRLMNGATPFYDGRHDVCTKPLASTGDTPQPQELIEKVLIGGNHLASWLFSEGCDPAEVKDYAAAHRHGAGVADVWLAWRAIMDLSESLRTKPDAGEEK